MLRRKKEEVEESIPPLAETIIDVEMTNIQKKIYRALYEKNKHML
jgi:chromodomain-helicase-DNA-binding protein 7